MPIADTLIEQVEYARKWTLSLVDDFQDEDWVFQPKPGLHHALWLCGHLATAQDTLIFQRCLGLQGRLGPEFRAHFPIGKPVASAAEHAYPPPESVLTKMAEVHAASVEAIRSMTDAALSQPAYASDGKSEHPQYRTKLGAVAHAARHETFHAGQIAMLRRLLGKEFLR
jgi:hypothetical protein